MQFGYQVQKRNVPNPNPGQMPPRVWQDRYDAAAWNRLEGQMQAALGEGYIGITINNLDQDHDVQIEVVDPLDGDALAALTVTIDTTFAAWQQTEG